jgi:ribonuclease BN (tRNA processing enzyme)
MSQAEQSGLKLTIVGCAPAYTARRPGWVSSCYLVESGDEALVMDMGQGSFAELSRYRRPESIAGVLISHLHADHLVDLIPLRHYLRYGAGDEGTAVRLHGPTDLHARMNAFQDEDDFLAPLRGDHLTPGRMTVGGFDVEARHVTHIPDSFGFRVSLGDRPGLVYSGDCGAADDLLPLIREGDTLLCEAAFGDDEASGGSHLTARQAAGAAARGKAARLVLTHVLDPHADDVISRAAAEAFDGEVVVAQPGLRLPIN